MMAINIFLDMNFFPDIIKMSWETQLERAGAGDGAGAVTMEIWNSGVATSGMPSLELGAVRLAWCHKNGILSFVQRRASMFPSKARICIGLLRSIIIFNPQISAAARRGAAISWSRCWQWHVVPGGPEPAPQYWWWWWLCRCVYADYIRYNPSVCFLQLAANR